MPLYALSLTHHHIHIFIAAVPGTDRRIAHTHAPQIGVTYHHKMERPELAVILPLQATDRFSTRTSVSSKLRLQPGNHSSQTYDSHAKSRSGAAQTTQPLRDLERGFSDQTQNLETKPNLSFARLDSGWFGKYLCEDLQPSHWLDATLLLLHFCVTMLDAAAFWSFDTHTSLISSEIRHFTVLGVAEVDDLPAVSTVSHPWKMKGIATCIGSFIAGSFVVGNLGRVFGPRRRWWLLSAVGFQTGLVLVIAAIGFQQPHDRHQDINSRECVIHHSVEYEHLPSHLATLALLAFHAGARQAMTLDLNAPLSPAAVTGTLVKLARESPFVWNSKRTLYTLHLIVFLSAVAVAGTMIGHGKSGRALVLMVFGLEAVATRSVIFLKGVKFPEKERRGDGSELDRNANESDALSVGLDGVDERVSSAFEIHRFNRTKRRPTQIYTS